LEVPSEKIEYQVVGCVVVRKAFEEMLEKMLNVRKVLRMRGIGGRGECISSKYVERIVPRRSIIL
jgi:hypothetical protein